MATALAAQQRGGVEIEAAGGKRLAEVDPCRVPLPHGVVRLVRRGLVATEAARDLAFGPALRGVEEGRVNRHDKRAFDGRQLAGEVLGVADGGFEARAAQVVGGLALEPADAALAVGGPGEIEADEGGHGASP